MINCADELLDFYRSQIRLTEVQRKEMRDRRTANEARLNKGLERLRHPLPYRFQTQGSYAMRTMVQDSTTEYDIDNGAYFLPSGLVGSRGNPISALDARKRVCEALQDSRLKRPPEVKTNCVRVYYKKGYHVDIPVYRAKTCSDTGEVFYHELASSEWKRSDARDVTRWFLDENKERSPDSTDGGQFRRIIKYLKYFSKSRDSWARNALSGFAITKLVSECFSAAEGRDDIAFVYTAQAIVKRLRNSTEIAHPVTPNESIVDEQDSRARCFKERLENACERLSKATGADSTREQALRCWDFLFVTEFFTETLGENRAPAEEFIEEKGFQRGSQFLAFPVRIEGRVIRKHGFRDGPLEGFKSVGKGRKIEFRVETSIPHPYRVFWKVRNRGQEAAECAELRGEIRESKESDRIIEPTAYVGSHYVEAYIVKDGLVVGQGRITVKIA